MCVCCRIIDGRFNYTEIARLENNVNKHNRSLINDVDEGVHRQGTWGLLA